MWIFMNDAFLSIVAHRDKPDHFMVRARLNGDLERVFPGATVTETPDADYRYRATLTREAVAATIQERLAEIDYPNFKGSIGGVGGDHGHERARAYGSVWSDMLDAQDRAC